MLAREQDNFRAALDWSLERGDQAGPRLARALGGFWLGRGLLAEGRDWLDRALAQRPADQRLRADLLRLLGAVLFEAGDLEGADAVLSEGSQVAAAAGAPAVAARIRVLRADIAELAGRGTRRTRWLNARRRQLSWNPRVTWTDWPRRSPWLAGCGSGSVTYQPARPVLERAITCARQSGNHRAQMRASHWLAVTFSLLPIPADTGVARAEQLLAEASGDLWAEADLLKPLCVLYAHVGRVADARRGHRPQPVDIRQLRRETRPGRKRRPGRHSGPDHR